MRDQSIIVCIRQPNFYTTSMVQKQGIINIMIRISVAEVRSVWHMVLKSHGLAVRGEERSGGSKNKR